MTAEIKDLKIDRSRKGVLRSAAVSRWLFAGLATAAVAGAGSLLFVKLTTATEVQTVRVSSGPIKRFNERQVILNATGYIVASHYIELASKVVGRVEWIGVEEGDRIQAGQELVRLESEEYRAQLVQAQGQLDSLRAKLAELENGSRPEEILKSKADVEQSRVDLDNLRVTLGRTRELAQAGILSRQALDDAQAKYDSAAARLVSIERVHDLVRLGPRAEQILSVRAQVSQAQGAVDYARTNVENTVIRAPVSGTILARNVERGEFVTTAFVGDRGAKGYVVSMANLDDLQVEVDVNQADFAKLQPRQPAIVTVDAYPDRKYEGFIEEVSPEANRQKATVHLKVKVSKPDSILRPEMNASVAFYSPAGSPSVKPATRSIALPPSSVRDGVVFVAADRKVFRRDPSTLIGGEDVVVNPPAGLTDGQRVRLK